MADKALRDSFGRLRLDVRDRCGGLLKRKLRPVVRPVVVAIAVKPKASKMCYTVEAHKFPHRLTWYHTTVSLEWIARFFSVKGVFTVRSFGGAADQ